MFRADSTESFEANENLIKEILAAQESVSVSATAVGDSGSLAIGGAIDSIRSDQDHPNSDPQVDTIKRVADQQQASLANQNAKSLSNQDLLFRAVERRTNVTVNFSDDVTTVYSETNRHSLPVSLSPLNVPSGDKRPSLTRTQECALLPTRRQCDETSEEVAQKKSQPPIEPRPSSPTLEGAVGGLTGNSLDTPVTSPETTRRKRGSITSPTSTMDDENFDTASSELYVSQENICKYNHVKKWSMCIN